MTDFFLFFQKKKKVLDKPAVRRLFYTCIVVLIMNTIIEEWVIVFLSPIKVS